MGKALVFLLALYGGALIGILAAPAAHDRPGGAFLGFFLSIPVALCALWIWQGAERQQELRRAAREEHHRASKRMHDRD